MPKRNSREKCLKILAISRTSRFQMILLHMDLRNMAVIMRPYLITSSRELENKCKFNHDKLKVQTSEISFFGHLILKEGIKSDPRKGDMITHMNPLEDERLLASFLELVNYFNKFSPPLARLINHYGTWCPKTMSWLGLIGKSIWDHQKGDKEKQSVKILQSKCTHNTTAWRAGSSPATRTNTRSICQ